MFTAKERELKKVRRFLEEDAISPTTQSAVLQMMTFSLFLEWRWHLNTETLILHPMSQCN
jgi:hypothetical protein